MASDSEDLPEHIDVIKASFRRRLKNRWRCEARDHKHCYANLNGTHKVPLTDEDMEIWVSALVCRISC